MMTAMLAGPLESVSLPDRDVQAARDSGLALAEFVEDDTQRLTLRLESPETGRHIEAAVPAAALRVLVSALIRLGEGRSVTLLPSDADLSLQQAADLLGVSRSYFTKLLDQGRLSFQKVGNQRRVRVDVLQQYMASAQQEGLAALKEMASENQRLGLYE